jgi:hypothetical protein
VTETTVRTTRAQRMAMPLAREVVKDLAVEHGACIRPIQLRRTNLDTGEADTVLVPCGHTLAHVCPSCAERARTLRAAQCREGWHLEDEPAIEPDPATDDQKWWIEKRSEAQQLRDAADAAGTDTTDLDELLAELDEEITKAGMRGKAAPDRPARRHRSTRRRQDASDLPRRKVSSHSRTVGKTYTAPDGKTFRPSLFVTLTCPSYGRVSEDGTPTDPAAYDYDRAARDALAFAALFDRFIQNLRRYLGYDVQYFAAIEPQRRLAPHVHLAIRGTVSRAELRRVLAATYHQVWWPNVSEVKYDEDELPVWDEATGGYLDPATGEVLPTWDQALDAIGPDEQPWHVARFGVRFDAQGVLAGSKDAARCIGYLTKYLTKQGGDCHQADTDTQRAHASRLAGALRFQPCSPRCANWLRYGIQPKNARPGLAPGRCKGKAHDADHLGYGGRRVLVPASGPVRRWPTTAPTARTGCCGPSVFRQPTRPGTPGNRSPRPTRTTWTMRGGCCMPSPTVHAGKPHSTRPGAERLYPRTVIIRQRERRHDGPGRSDSAAARCERGSPAAWDRAAVRPAPGRGTTDRVSQARPSRAHQRSCPSRVHQGRTCPSGDICPQAGGLMPGRKSRHFGNIRKLPSGRYQARYRGPDGRLRTAPSTFGRKTDAALWLSQASRDCPGGLDRAGDGTARLRRVCGAVATGQGAEDPHDGAVPGPARQSSAAHLRGNGDGGDR